MGVTLGLFVQTPQYFFERANNIFKTLFIPIITLTYEIVSHIYFLYFSLYIILDLLSYF
jgi:hypothetical protein